MQRKSKNHKDEIVEKRIDELSAADLERMKDELTMPAGEFLAAAVAAILVVIFLVLKPGDAYSGANAARHALGHRAWPLSLGATAHHGSGRVAPEPG